MFVLNTVAVQKYGRCSERTKERYNKMTETLVSVIFSLVIRKIPTTPDIFYKYFFPFGGEKIPMCALR